jgi:ketosteroid isomerase-like protein
MNDMDIQDFVTRFAAAWAASDGEAFLALWHPDGVLHSPLYDRPVAGKELGRLTALVRETAPDHVWQLLDWTARGDVVIVEWQATRTAGGRRLDWRGVQSTSSACATDASSRRGFTWTRQPSGRRAASCGPSR